MGNLLRRTIISILKTMKFLPIEKYVGYYYEYYTGEKYHDHNPQTFCEKIQWYKAHYHPPILSQLVDKYAVRSYVTEKIGEQYLNRCLGVYDHPSDIDFDLLPNKFVIKGVHGYGFNLIVPDKDKLDRFKAKLKLYKWYKRNQYYRGGLEWAYKNIKPRFIIEEFMEELNRNSISDYKFFCFDGKAKFLELHLDRSQNHQSGYFDLNFNPLPFNDVPPDEAVQGHVEKPTNFEEMIALAETLADQFPFVRVDFYSINGRSVFGEMTFYPADGRSVFTPKKYNQIIGDYFKLPSLPNGQKEITHYK